MPISRGDKEYLLPVQGLNTEANLLHFPQEYTPGVINMEVDYSPMVVRPRKGVSVTDTPVLAETRATGDHDIGITSFLWEAVAGDSDLNFVVVQVGRYIYFLDDSDLTDADAATESKRLDVNDMLSGTTEGTLALAEPSRLEFANVKGSLLICSPQIDPTVIQYISGAFEATALNLQVRDLLGIEDGLKVDERPTTLSDDHHYNLLNQGWRKQRRVASGSATESDPITTFYNAFTPKLYPSNADVVYLGMIEDAGDLIFDPEWLRDQTFGATPAARGHFIMDVFNIDREDGLAHPDDWTGNTGGSWGNGSPYWGVLPTYDRF